MDNKYKEALKIYSCLENENTIGEYTPLEYQKARMVLEELVEKGTPKKVEINKSNKIYYTYCPNCKELLSINSTEAFLKDNFCRSCGQRLEYENE